MDVLAHLLENPGRVVASNELLDRFWNGSIGEPGMISKRVGQIRRTLGDDQKQPTYIETIARRGYRTVSTVANVAAPASGPYTPLHNSIAVLPFENLSSEADNAYFAAGIHGDLAQVIK